MTTMEIINVFSAGAGGGNPAPIVLDADGMSDRDMQEVAQYTGHESAFVLRPDPQDSADFAFRFWVPTKKWKCAAMPPSPRPGCLRKPDD